MTDQASVARDLYRRWAPTYDRVLDTAFVRPLRRRAIEGLGLRRGDTVLDAACGTGASFEQLEERVGPEGAVIGIDLSPEMLERARARTAIAGWRNVNLIEGDLGQVDLPETDAVLLFLTHDVMRSPTALANIVAALRPGGRVAAFGAKRTRGLARPLNVAVNRGCRRAAANLGGLDRPWDLLAELVDLEIDELLVGTAYLAIGSRP